MLSKYFQYVFYRYEGANRIKPNNQKIKVPLRKVFWQKHCRQIKSYKTNHYEEVLQLDHVRFSAQEFRLCQNNYQCFCQRYQNGNRHMNFSIFPQGLHLFSYQILWFWFLLPNFLVCFEFCCWNSILQKPFSQGFFSFWSWLLNDALNTKVFCKHGLLMWFLVQSSSFLKAHLLKLY